MKKFFITAMCISLMTLAGCNKASADSQINEKAKVELSQRYPDAVNVKWTTKNGYYVAKFNKVATRSIGSEFDFSVWFNRAGQWCMTESEISYDALPEVVKAAFQASEYATWKVEDIDKLERSGMETFYVIEAETRSGNIEKEVDLYYSESGALIKTVVDIDSDYDYEDYLPADIQSELSKFVAQKYLGAVIMDTEFDDGEFEVEIVHEGRGKDVYFSKDYNWLRTEWDVRKNELPAAVLAQLNASYPSWKIDDAEYVETPSGDWFKIELEKGDSEVKIRITPAGVIL